MEAWQGRDVEHNDLQSFLEKCNSNETLIPGPAGNIQVAMLNRLTDEPQSTQEFVNNIAKATYERDFNSNPWLWAEMFIKHHGLVEHGNMDNMTKLECGKSMLRLPFVACIVKQCNPNGFGDMKISVKDPSATVSASVHKKVLLHPEFGLEIGVGVVLLLQRVAVFMPNRRTYYLNITVRNVVKVFKADIGPPTEELVRAFSKPHVACEPCGESNKEKQDVGPSEMPTTSASNNADTAPMEE
ncbi:hypothetical protein V8G54_025275 [Vigna mungo]|uniref:Homologous recombination OB-fold protein OB-fold domain-containing protein n=1 Tax=Vigna mungo TaxID=3915 RepID=A0AAQ3N7E7_VIGMU